MPESKEGKLREDLRCPNCMSPTPTVFQISQFLQCAGHYEDQVQTFLGGVKKKVKLWISDGCGFGTCDEKEFWKVNPETGAPAVVTRDLHTFLGGKDQRRPPGD